MAENKNGIACPWHHFLKIVKHAFIYDKSQFFYFNEITYIGITKNKQFEISKNDNF
jgi:hypothetical protein